MQKLCKQDAFLLFLFKKFLMETICRRKFSYNFNMHLGVTLLVVGKLREDPKKSKHFIIMKITVVV